MRQFILKSILTIGTILFIVGCSTKVDTSQINTALLPTQDADITKSLESKTYSTYNEKEERITRYYFKNADGKLKVMNEIVFLPRYSPMDLYGFEIRDISIALRDVSDGKAKTIEEALVAEVKKNNFTRLYKNKQEYIIGNEFARTLMNGIDKFSEKMEARENRD